MCAIVSIMGFSCVVAAYYCPKYDDIAQPSVAGGVWSQEELKGLWYLVATTEPTIPTKQMRACSVLNWTIYTNVYRYATTGTQSIGSTRYNFTVNLGGYKSTDPSRPGDCMETISVLNCTLDFALMRTPFLQLLQGGWLLHVVRVHRASGRPRPLLLHACLEDTIRLGALDRREGRLGQQHGLLRARRTRHEQRRNAPDIMLGRMTIAFPPSPGVSLAHRTKRDCHATLSSLPQSKRGVAMLHIQI